MDTVDILYTFDNISITDMFEVVDTVDVLENINGCPHKLPGPLRLQQVLVKPRNTKTI